MAHDYLFRRYLNNAARAAWRWSFPSRPAAVETGGGGRLLPISPRPRVVSRAALAWQVPRIIDEAATEGEIKRLMFPDMAQRAYAQRSLRPSAAALFTGSPRPLPIQQPVGRKFWDFQARGRKRAAPTAYFISNLPPASLEAEEPILRRSLPDRVYPRRRAANTAYLITNRMQEDPDKGETLIRRMIPERAPGPRRAGRTAYDINSTFVPTDVVVPPFLIGATMLPQRAPGYRRTANPAYWLPMAWPPIPARPALLTCVEMVGQDFTTPDLSLAEMTTPTVSDPDFTTPDVLGVDVC